MTHILQYYFTTETGPYIWSTGENINYIVKLGFNHT